MSLRSYESLKEILLATSSTGLKPGEFETLTPITGLKPGVNERAVGSPG